MNGNAVSALEYHALGCFIGKETGNFVRVNGNEKRASLGNIGIQLYNVYYKYEIEARLEFYRWQ